MSKMLFARFNFKHLPMQMKLIVSFLAIVLLPVLLVTWFAVNQINDRIEAGLQNRVKESLNVALNAYKQSQQQALYNAKVLAELRALQADVIENRRLDLIQLINIKRLQLDDAITLEVADGKGKILAKSYEAVPDRREYLYRSYDPTIMRALRHSSSISVRATENGIVVKGVVPIRTYADPFGVVLLGYLLDDDFAEKIRQITGTDVGIRIYLKDSVIAAAAAFLTQPEDNPKENLQRIKALPPDPEIVKIIQNSGQIGIQRQERILNHEYQTAYAPIVNEYNEPIGMVSVAIQRDHIDAIKSLSTTLLFVAALIGVVLATLTAALISQSITVPIRRFVEGAKAISAGDFTQRIDLNSRDEIGELSHTFNQMTRDLFDQREQLKKVNLQLSQYATELEITNKELTEAKQRIERWNEELEQTVKERTEQLEISNRELQRLNEMRTEFLNMATHELRTPITAIKGYSDFLLMGMMGEINDKQSKAVAVIKESGERLLALINDMLDLAKIEAGRIQLEIEPSDLRMIVHNNLAMVRPLAEDKGIHLENKIPDDIPYVYVDKDKITQVFTNLLSNAIKYTDQDGRITVSAAKVSSEQIEVRVADTGVGIPKEDLPKVFEKFSKISNQPTRNEKGTGLGLPIVKLIVDSHGGKIGVESEVGIGTAFYFSLPIYIP